MPKRLTIGQLLRQKCTCSGAACFQQFTDDEIAVQQERNRFHELDGDCKESGSVIQFKFCGLLYSLTRCHQVGWNPDKFKVQTLTAGFSLLLESIFHNIRKLAFENGTT